MTADRRLQCDGAEPPHEAAGQPPPVYTCGPTWRAAAAAISSRVEAAAVEDSVRLGRPALAFLYSWRHRLGSDLDDEAEKVWAVALSRIH